MSTIKRQALDLFVQTLLFESMLALGALILLPHWPAVMFLLVIGTLVLIGLYLVRLGNLIEEA